MFSIFPKNDKDQTLRIKRFLIAFGAYIIWGAICFIAYSLGLTKVPLKTLIAGVSGTYVSNILLYAIFRTGFNKKFKDPSLTLLQMVIATFWIMVIIYYAYEARSAILLVYMVVLVFGFFRLKVRQFLFLSVFALINYSVVIFILYKIHPEYINKSVDILNIVVLAFILPWFAVLGGYITNLRSTVSKSLSTIKRLTDNIHDVIFVVDMNLKYNYVSPSVKILRGYEPEEVMQQAFSDAFAPSSANAAVKTVTEIMELEKSGSKDTISRILQLEVKHKDGTTVWTETNFSLVKDKHNRTVGILGASRDIDERKRMEKKLHQSEEKYRTIIEKIEDGYFEVDLAGNLTFFNNATCELYGYSKEELMGMNYRRYADKENAKKLFQVFNEVYKTGKGSRLFEYEAIRKDGTKRQVEIFASLMKDSAGNLTGFRGIIRDITERRRAEEQIRYLATHDTLTGLPNRSMFTELLNQAIKSAKRNQRQFAILFIDLDRFKIINDTLGHDAGDQLLREMADRFRQSLRAVDIVGRLKENYDVVGRLGGDEFIILIEEIKESSQPATVAQKILNVAMKPVAVLGEECRVTASIGISIYPNDGLDEQTLMKNADMAMYFAKEEGKNNFQFYS
ncbi:MAG: diguanylate cyclase, partial [Syntrophaceae bacterium]|nr:diguanylate cyclase [Syntrophaceae bacterium]